MNTNSSVVMRVRCNDDDCGMVSAYEIFADGSFRRIVEACCHPKTIPNRDEVLKTIKDKENRP